MTPRVLQLVLRGNFIKIYSESKILRRKLSQTCYVSVPLSVSGLHKVMVMINTGPGHRDSSHGREAGLLACVGLGEAFCHFWLFLCRQSRHVASYTDHRARSDPNMIDISHRGM